MALMVAATSGAPFPRAKSVTPAKRGGRPKWRENSSRPGEKNFVFVFVFCEILNIIGEVIFDVVDDMLY